MRTSHARQLKLAVSNGFGTKGQGQTWIVEVANVSAEPFFEIQIIAEWDEAPAVSVPIAVLAVGATPRVKVYEDAGGQMRDFVTPRLTATYSDHLGNRWRLDKIGRVTRVQPKRTE